MPESFIINNKTVSNKTNIANAFNKYFINIGPSLSNKIPATTDKPDKYMKSHIIESIFIKPVVENEVESLIKNLKTAAAGWDSISSDIVKNAYKSFIKPLTHVLNLSITKGVFPNCMKIAKVLPLFKSGEKTKISNYRPISILPVFSKLLERLMYNRILSFIDKHKLLYSNQFGFRVKHSTALALSVLVDKITTSFTEQKTTVGVFLDFSKAFDTVNHDILLQKLYSYGIRGLAYDWVKSYISNRYQYVVFDNVCSNRELITCGVPQGSILGPLLFILYINDIAHVSDKLYSILFADDSNMFCTGSNINTLISTMNNELKKVIDWLNINKLSLNVDKSNYMVFSRKHILTVCDVSINSTSLNRIYQTKFLGVHIDWKLSWNYHVTYVKNKIAKSIGILCKAKKTLKSDSLITLYYSFVFPYLSYCMEIWGGCCYTVLKPLFIQQKRIIKIISSDKGSLSSTSRFKQLKILTVSKVYVYKLLLFCFKYANNMLPNTICDLFIHRSEIHSYNTRNSNALELPRLCPEYVKQSFKYNVIKVYNKAISMFDFALKYKTFKSKIREYLLDNDFIY
jgi:hypothetical protein